MVLEIIRLAIMVAMLICGLVVAWYAHKIHASHARGLAFLDGQDIDHRRSRAETSKARHAWQYEISTWLRDTRAILGKLYSIAAETSHDERDTRLMPPPPAPPVQAARAPLPRADVAIPVDLADTDGDRLSDSDATTYCMDKSLAMAALTAEAEPQSFPETKPKPGITPVSRQRVSPTAPTRFQPAVSPDRSLSLSEGRQDGAVRSEKPRFPETMMSMQATTEPGSAPPSPARPMAPIETKEVCRECDGGFVAVGVDGIRKCRICDGSSFVDVLAQ